MAIEYGGANVIKAMILFASFSFFRSLPENRLITYKMKFTYKSHIHV